MENFATDPQIHGYTLRGLHPRVKTSGGFFSFCISCLLIISFSHFCFGQSSLSTSSKKARKLYEKADKQYKNRDFYAAIDYLEQSVREDPDFFEAYIRMGSLYNAIGREDSVYSKFTSYIRTAPDPIASVIERLAFMAFDRGEYYRSSSYLSKFLDKVPERSSDFEINLLSRSIDFAINQVTNSKDSVLVATLPKEVNRFRLQYLPSVTIDDAAIFYTKRDNVRGDEDIVVSYKKDGEWLPAQSVSSRINTPLNEGACAVSADGRTMIFTSCDGRNSLGSCDLYISKKVGDQWSYPKNLGKPVNTMYWESQPSLSADGKTLYFSSNRRGGFGGRDLWVSTNKKGNWSKPINLGENVNTRKDETTPFIHPNGSSLYFSANGYPGMGGYDLYVSERLDSTWSQPKNLGYPINTYKDEVSIVINASGSAAYFAKEQQKNYEILDSKLVSIQLPKQLEPKAASYIIGKIMDANDESPLKADIQVVSLLNNETVYNSTSDSISGSYYMVLPVGLDLAAYVKKKGYLYSDFQFTTENNSLHRPDTIDIYLTPVNEGKKLILKNIYFEVDSYKLNDRSLSELQNAYELLKENPDIKVEIAGHTDNTGDYLYNLSLSELRAKAVYEKMILRGISDDRISYKGYADTQPTESNETEMGRKSNRRIEFRVLRMMR
ncbi:OmpA family protein [Ekhidna sp.]|uniref:OmpA family protein n=1 Tax=Ekhidna sp. TaxID=2608089 RepID=UPI003CCBF16C